MLVANLCPRAVVAGDTRWRIDALAILADGATDAAKLIASRTTRMFRLTHADEIAILVGTIRLGRTAIRVIATVSGTLTRAVLAGAAVGTVTVRGAGTNIDARTVLAMLALAAAHLVPRRAANELRLAEAVVLIVDVGTVVVRWTLSVEAAVSRTVARPVLTRATIGTVCIVTTEGNIYARVRLARLARVAANLVLRRTTDQFWFTETVILVDNVGAVFILWAIKVKTAIARTVTDAVLARSA